MDKVGRVKSSPGQNSSFHFQLIKQAGCHDRTINSEVYSQPKLRLVGRRLRRSVIRLVFRMLLPLSGLATQLNK